MPSSDKRLLYNAPPQEKKSKEVDKREMMQMDYLLFMENESPVPLAHLSVLPVGAKNSVRNLELLEVCEDSNRPTHTSNDTSQKRWIVNERDKKQEKKIEKDKPERKVTQKKIQWR